jgi:hypothetical protein
MDLKMTNAADYMKEYNYVILSSLQRGSSHFSYNIESYRVDCTHGGWGGTLVINEDGTCLVDLGFDGVIVNYTSFKFTDLVSYCDCVSAKLI